MLVAKRAVGDQVDLRVRRYFHSAGRVPVSPVGRRLHPQAMHLAVERRPGLGCLQAPARAPTGAGRTPARPVFRTAGRNRSGRRPWRKRGAAG